MKKLAVVTIALAAFALGASAAGTVIFDLDHARVAQRLEIQVDKVGNYVEFEYHILPAQVPQPVRDAMKALHGSEDFIDAEMEYVGDVLHYELNVVKTDGMEAEAMFTPEGELYSQEIQVPADAVPDEVKTAISTAWPEGTVKAWEEIRKGDGTLEEYHVKLTDDGIEIKAMVSPMGMLKGAVREVPAEMEIPLAIPMPR